VIGYFDILLTRHQPKEIVFYAGENDLNAGNSPSAVAARFAAFMALKTERLGDAPVYFVSIKPSYARLKERAAQITANGLIKSMADSRDDLIYIDVASPMMNGETPKPIFISDQLHMTLDGYKIWTGILAPILANPARPVRTGCSP
jgi:lysophospholipase L1-like esterase